MVRRLFVAVCVSGMIISSGVSAQRASDHRWEGRAGDSVDRPARVWSANWRYSLQPQCGGYGSSTPCYDQGQTQQYCPFCGEQRMHSCPEGFAITGAGSGNNVFQCSFIGQYADAYFETGGTQRQSSIACRPGYFIVGMHEKNNVLLCASVGRYVGNEYRVSVGAMTSCVANVFGFPVMTGWNAERRYMLCAVL